MSAAPGPDARARARLYQLAAALVTAGLIVAVLLAVFSSSGSPRLVPGRPVPGAAKTLALFAGIPQQGLVLGQPRELRRASGARERHHATLDEREQRDRQPEREHHRSR